MYSNIEVCQVSIIHLDELHNILLACSARLKTTVPYGVDHKQAHMKLHHKTYLQNDSQAMLNNCCMLTWHLLRETF